MGVFSALHAYYAADIETFLASDPKSILGILSSSSQFSIEQTQRDAWEVEIDIIRPGLRQVTGSVFLEFVVPRIGSRLDVVLLSGPAIFAIEFKVGEKHFTRDTVNQVWDYALDLKNFHRASHQAPVFPILVATEAIKSDETFGYPSADSVFPPAKCNILGFTGLLRDGLRRATGEVLDAVTWGNSPYQPTPTIIQAAQALYAQHSVEAIARNEAGHNLTVTSQEIERLVDQARQRQEKTIIFVTGVPGAGKTLVGLNIATKRRDTKQPTHAVFLSGNGPLVRVLTEALARDEVLRLRKANDNTRKGVVKQKVKAFIQNVHHFRDAGLKDELPPPDHVVIFDEAQRAWDHRMTSDFMLRKKKRAGFNQSEPGFLISYLHRHKDWAVIVCLVGGGQEINRGEAGISEWLNALCGRFPDWQVYVSPDLTDSEYSSGDALNRLSGRLIFSKALHLSVSMRSFRAEHVSSFVKAVLDCEVGRARELRDRICERYPIVLTRNLSHAKNWIRQKARGSERFGLVASSEALRLKPHAIDIRVDIDPVHWFLNDATDTRSSYYLEDAASQFEVQGLELDWVCVTWDADFRHSPGGWKYHSFRGTKWTNIGKTDRQQFLKNAYRVLLTRARQGMVIFVPEGEKSDPTRAPGYYDATFQYLADIGIPVLSQ